ncbi:MAG: Ribonuclease, partial [Candidatus Saccharibacteria bacterium]|nr:Ribonuclease [Candidatus Saccharibacteria bacterium]
SPHLFSAQDWRFVLLETRIALKDKKMPILAAGSAFYASLAFFPLIAAIIAIVAYTVDVNELNSALSAIEIYFPIDIAALIGSQLESAFEYNLRNVVVAIVAILIALYSASRAMYALISATNTAYEQVEKRKVSKLIGMSFLMALGAIFVMTLVLGLVLIDEPALSHMGVPEFYAISLPVLRWLFLAIIIAVSLALFYRFAPSNHNPHWKWVSWGAGIASIIWLAGTTLFFLYAKYLSVYSNIYNVFGSVIVLLVWFNLSTFIILLGAEINHRLEQRTTRRTSS